MLFTVPHFVHLIKLLVPRGYQTFLWQHPQIKIPNWGLQPWVMSHPKQTNEWVLAGTICKEQQLLHSTYLFIETKIHFWFFWFGLGSCHSFDGILMNKSCSVHGNLVWLEIIARAKTHKAENYTGVTGLSANIIRCSWMFTGWWFFLGWNKLD